MEECWLTKSCDLSDSVLQLEKVNAGGRGSVPEHQRVRGHSTPPLLGLQREWIARGQETTNKKRIEGVAHEHPCRFDHWRPHGHWTSHRPGLRERGCAHRNRGSTGRSRPESGG